VDEDEARWRWLGDPEGEAPGFIARVAHAPGKPCLVYRTMVWTLVRESISPAVTGTASAQAYSLRYEVDGILSYPQWLAIPVWLDRRAHLTRKVEDLAAICPDPDEAESAVEQLLARAATEIDRWLGRWGFLEAKGAR
jgi:hypothetical protein